MARTGRTSVLLLGVATHLRPADSIKLPKQRGSKGCVQAERRGEAKKKKHKAIRRE